MTSVQHDEMPRHEREPKSAKAPVEQRPTPKVAALPLRTAILQAKLSVGAASDPYEVEADRVADRVVRSVNGGTSVASQVESDPSPDGAGGQAGVQRVQRAKQQGTTADTDDAPTASRVQRMHPSPLLDGSIRQDGTAQRTQRIQRRGDGRRRGAIGPSDMAPIILDLSMEELRTASELALEGIEQQTTTIVEEQAARAGNRIGGSFETSENVVNQMLSMAGLDKSKGVQKLKQRRRKNASKKRAKADPAGIDAKLAIYRERANMAMMEAEQRRIAAMNQRDDLSETDEYRRQLLVNKQRKRSMSKEKRVNKKDKKTGEVKEAYAGDLDVKQAGDVDYVVARDEKKSKVDKKTGVVKLTRKGNKASKKMTKQSATHVTTVLGKRFLRQSDIFKNSVSDFGTKIGSVVRGAVSPIESQQHSDLLATLTRSGQQNAAVRTAVAAGTMTPSDARRQAMMTGERAKAIAGVGGMPNGFVARYTQKVAALSTQAADDAFDSMSDPAVRDFEERLAQSMRKVQQQDEDGGYKKLGGVEKQFDTDLGPVSSDDDASVKEMRDDFRSFITDQSKEGLNNAKLGEVADEAVDLGFQKDLKSVFQILANQGVPKPDKAGALGSNKSLSITVTVPVDPSGIGRLELEFAVTGSCYPDGNLWVQSRLMIKGGVESPLPGVKIKAMAGLGFYLEAGSTVHDRLGTLMSFALFRRFRESALVPHQITDHLWGRASKAGVDNGEWKDKSAAKYDHANSWGRAVEESFEDDEYAESGGLVRAEAAVEVGKKLGGIHGVEAGASVEYQHGTRYTKESMANKRTKHAEKYAKGAYKGGSAHKTGFGVRERNLGEANNRFTFAADGAVGPFSAGFSAAWWGAEKEWWIDATVAATGGDFAGDPASVAARIATWAGQMANTAGNMIVQGDEKRRKGATVDQKDLKNLKKASAGVTELGGSLQGVITGQWGAQHAAWEQAAVTAANAPDVTRTGSDVKSAWNEAGAAHDGGGLFQMNDPTGLTGNLANQIGKNAVNSGAKKLLGQGAAAIGAGLGIEKSKSLKIVMRVIARPGDGRQSEIQFHILNEKSKSVNLLDVIGVGQTKDFPIFYAQMPSGKVMWMGGIGRDQVKRAVRHQKEIVEVAARRVPGGSLATKALKR